MTLFDSFDTFFIQIKSSIMSFKALLLLFLLMRGATPENDGNGFTFNGNLKLGGVAEVTPDGLFKLTNTTKLSVGRAFHSSPFSFKNSSTGNALSFSATFVFSIGPVDPNLQGQGMAFVIAPSKDISGGAPAQYLGIFNSTNDGESSNHIVAVELDTLRNFEFGDINDNHVGIDINSLTSVYSGTAGYFPDENGEFKKLTLASGEPIQAWVDYNGMRKQINVTLAPIYTDQPNVPSLSLDIDLSPIILDQMYVGFSSSTGQLVQSNYIMGWSFQMNGKAQLDLSKLSSLPHGKNSKKKQIILATALSVVAVLSAFVTSFVILLCVRRKSKFIDVIEEWEVQYGPHRFTYKDLFIATKGFRENELLGRGGFGQVYKGVLPVSNLQVAVKKISHESRQGMKEFVAEIATIGRLRHPNLVRLLGYSRRKGELFLVYDFMPNTSLDKFLFNKTGATLSWNQRLKIINDVASGLAYLHEEWAEVIVHRDIKASNVLLDGELNGKLGDFGLARCSNHGKDPQTTKIAGTLGYIAPELARTGKATTSTDVFAFGAFCLEVACGRRPVEPRGKPEEVILVDWVLACSREGEILKAADPKLHSDFETREIQLVLKLGLLCSHPVAAIRPRMSGVLQYLKGHDSLPENLDALLTHEQWVGLNHRSASQSQDSKPSLTITEEFISRGR